MFVLPEIPELRHEFRGGISDQAATEISSMVSAHYALWTRNKTKPVPFLARPSL